MNVLKTITENKKTIKFFERMIKELYYDLYKEYMHMDYTPEVVEMFFEDFKKNVKTLKAFDYSIHSVKMYRNGIGTLIIVNIKSEKLKRMYAISFKLRWW